MISATLVLICFSFQEKNRWRCWVASPGKLALIDENRNWGIYALDGRSGMHKPIEDQEPSPLLRDTPDTGRRRKRASHRSFANRATT
jgi:hypothetical protein